MYHGLLTLLSLISHLAYVSAFYPYHNPVIESGHTQNSKRKFVQHNSYKVDLHRVPRDNQFSVSFSNKPSLPDALAIDQDGNDYSYFAAMSFGSKATPMYMLIDTGSANTWVFSSDCKSDTCSIHNTFGKEDSTTLKTTSQTWDLAYGTGEVAGIVGSDTVAFANYSVNLGFGLAQNASADFNNYPMDGILGIGRLASSSLNTPTITQALDKQVGLAQNVLGIHLQRSADNTKDGEIVFGGVDSKFAGQLTYTNVANAVNWEIPVDDVLVAGKSAALTGKTAVLDTGTTFMLLPPADAAKLHALVPGSSLNGEVYTIPCSTNVQIQVKIGGKLYTISPKDYVGKPNTGGCQSTIIGHQAFGADQWILGDVFLKNVYAVFDFDQNRIGLSANGAASSSTTVIAPSSTTVTSSAASSTNKSGSSSSKPASQSMTTSGAPTASTTAMSSSTLVTTITSAGVTSTATMTVASSSTATSSTSSPSKGAASAFTTANMWFESILWRHLAFIWALLAFGI